MKQGMKFYKGVFSSILPSLLWLSALFTSLCVYPHLLSLSRPPRQKITSSGRFQVYRLHPATQRNVAFSPTLLGSIPISKLSGRIAWWVRLGLPLAPSIATRSRVSLLGTRGPLQPYKCKAGQPLNEATPGN